MTKLKEFSDFVGALGFKHGLFFVAMVMLLIVSGMVFGASGLITIVVLGIGATVLFKRSATILAGVKVVWVLLVALATFIPIWVIVTELSSSTATTLLGDVIGVVVSLVVAFQYAGSARKRGYHTFVVLAYFSYLAVAGFLQWGLTPTQRTELSEHLKIRIQSLARVATVKSDEVTAAGLRKEADEIRDMKAAQISLDEIYAKRLNWAKMRLTSARSPVFVHVGTAVWTECLDHRSDPHQYRGKVTMQVTDPRDGKIYNFTPAVESELLKLKASVGSKIPRFWDVGKEILVDPSTRIYQGFFPTSYVPAAQRLDNGEWLCEWVYSSDVELKPELPPAKWSVNMAKPGQTELINGVRVDVIAVHRVRLEPGQVSGKLVYIEPPWQPGEVERFVRAFDLRGQIPTTFISTVNGETQVYGSGEVIDPNPNKRLQRYRRGEFEIEASFPDEAIPSYVEFLYYRYPRVSS